MSGLLLQQCLPLFMTTSNDSMKDFRRPHGKSRAHAGWMIWGWATRSTTYNTHEDEATDGAKLEANPSVYHDDSRSSSQLSRPLDSGLAFDEFVDPSAGCECRKPRDLASGNRSSKLISMQTWRPEPGCGQTNLELLEAGARPPSYGQTVLSPSSPDPFCL